MLSLAQVFTAAQLTELLLHADYSNVTAMYRMRLTSTLWRVFVLSLGSALYATVVLVAFEVASHVIEEQGHRPDFADDFLASIPDLGPALDTAIVFALGFLLMFRINRAYERWWEARTLWGKLVNVSRNLAVKIETFVDLSPEERKEVRRWISGFCYLLKEHLCAGCTEKSLKRVILTADRPQHVPSYVTGRIYAQLTAWRDAGRLTEQQMWLIDQEARELLEVCGGCERIRNTIMAQSFPTLVRQCLFMYLIYMPWTLVGDLHFWTVPATLIASYVLSASEAIAHYIEVPFGEEDDHLDLNLVCGGIDRSVSEILDVDVLWTPATS